MTSKPRIQIWTTQIQSSFQDFFSRSSSAGIAILAFTDLAMFWANSPLVGLYNTFLHQPIHVQVFSLDLQFTFGHFVNDGLMVLFFLLVGLEIKREVLVGELSSAKRAALPLIAAVAGMIVPGAIYAWFNIGTSAAHGWGIPVATDIAFALGILALLGRRVPLGLKVFLAALAIADDLLAVAIIALFYTSTINATALLSACLVVVLLAVARRAGIQDLRVYALLGFALWVFVLHSGVHATIAGVVLALMVPSRARISPSSFVAELSGLTKQLFVPASDSEGIGRQLDVVHAIEQRTEMVQSPLQRMQQALQIPVDFVVLPLFALVNAGVALTGAVAEGLTTPLSLGIALGLVVGKQVGITLAVWLSCRMGLAQMPKGVSLQTIYGVAVLCGIGFTMALFVAQLTFGEGMQLDIARVSVFAASAISAILGIGILNVGLPKRAQEVAT